MSLDTLLEDYRQRDIIPSRQSPVGIVEREEKVFDISIKKGITIKEADSEVIIEELTDFTKNLEDSPVYQNADELIEVFDPSEPPEGAGIDDPMGDLIKAEIAIIREPVKWALRASTYIFAPIDRAFKFLTNAAMYEPLTKSVAAPIRRQILIDLENTETLKRLKPEQEKLRVELLEKHKGDKDAFLKEHKQRLSEIEEQIRQQVKKDMAGIVKAEKEEISELPKVGIKDIGKSTIDALKSLVPWPGFADDVKSTGEIAASSFERITGRDAPWYYAPVTDIAEQTVALGGLLRIANSIQTSKNAGLISKGVKLTRTEVKAIKKLHKAASQVKKIPITSTTVPSPTDAATVTQKLIRLIKEAKPLRNKKALLLHQDRQRKTSKLVQVQKRVEGIRLVKATKGALKGKAPIPDFTPINANLSAQEIDVLFNLINTSQLSVGFDKGRAFLSLDKLLKGKLIVKSEIANLEAVFGKQLTKALFGKQSIASIIQDVSFEVINLPRAILASYDLSAAGRQGIIFSVSHPIASMKAFGRSVRAAVSLQYSDDIERITRTTRFGKLADSFGVHSSPTGFAAKLSAKEEIYLSRVAERIPGIAQSERAFTTFLNQQRREVFAVQAKKWIRQGITPEKNQKTYQQFANFVNHATGRGSLETLQPGALTALNAVFFSPRFQVSRIQVIGDLISPKTTAIARKVIARDLAEFYITGMGILTVAKMGGAEVETDPRSANFGKVQVGNTRYNYWGGFQPLASLAGRIYSGEIKSTGTDKIKDKSRIATIGTFLRTKLAPVPGRLVDLGIGETFLGEPVEPTAEFIGKTTYESLVPLFVQDSVDAWRFQGSDAQLPISSGLAFIGIGVQTWEVAPFAELELARDSLSRQTYGKNYDQLSFTEVSMLDRDILVNHPNITALEQEAKFNSNSVNFLKKQAIELRKSERFLNKRVNKKLLADLNELKLRLGGVDRTFGNWRLNDEQYKEYQEKVAKNINSLFQEMKPLWDTKPTEGKFELMSTLLRSAKLLAADEMKIGDME
ncbi:MAG: hypothetical protein ACUZ9M_00645 [Candidatus Scalindua sp.]